MNKHSILKLLEENKDQPISGQKIAELLCISRNAVWKHINALKSEGFQITSSKSGYLLSEDSSKVSISSIKSKINVPLNIYVFDSLPSTNTYAINNISELKKPALIIALEQTEGRGRFNKKFSSKADNGIYMSFLVENTALTRNISLITAMSSVAVTTASRRLFNNDVKIKWVNDIFYNGLKAAGILTEGVTNFETGTISHIVVGMGINTSNKELPSDLKTIAGPICDQEVNKNLLIAEIANEFFHMYENLCTDDISFMDKYRKFSLILGKEISYKDFSKNQIYKGLAKDIDNQGHLLIQLSDGSIFKAASGEVSVILN